MRVRVVRPHENVVIDLRERKDRNILVRFLPQPVFRKRPDFVAPRKTERVKRETNRCAGAAQAIAWPGKPDSRSIPRRSCVLAGKLKRQPVRSTGKGRFPQAEAFGFSCCCPAKHPAASVVPYTPASLPRPPAAKPMDHQLAYRQADGRSAHGPDAWACRRSPHQNLLGIDFDALANRPSILADPIPKAEPRYGVKSW